MSTLAETAYYTRRGINWAILTIIVYLILRLTWSFLVAAVIFLFPAKPAQPNHAYGKLPALAFPAPESSPSAQFSYRLETITGTLPVASDSGRVYFMPKSAANLLAISKTQEFAKVLTFDSQPIQETRTIYRFEDSLAPVRKLRYDIVSNNFILRYGYEQDTGLFSEGVLRDPEKVQQQAIAFLLEHNLYKNDIERGTQTVTYLKLVGNTLVPVTNTSQADAMRVEFFRGGFNRFKLMTPNPSEGQVRMLFSGSLNPKKKILEVIYTHWPVDPSSYATYELKPIGQAWQELQSGNGYVARYPTNGELTAVIRNVYLAYYDSFDPQTYLQPIYVFEGDHGFMGYVGAITPEWVE